VQKLQDPYFPGYQAPPEAGQDGNDTQPAAAAGDKGAADGRRARGAEEMQGGAAAWPGNAALPDSGQLRQVPGPGSQPFRSPVRRDALPQQRDGAAVAMPAGLNVQFAAQREAPLQRRDPAPAAQGFNSRGDLAEPHEQMQRRNVRRDRGGGERAGADAPSYGSAPAPAAPRHARANHRWAAMLAYIVGTAPNDVVIWLSEALSL